MPALDLFTDFVKQTGKAVASSPDKIVNDAQLRNYTLFDKMTSNREKQFCDGGSEIQDFVKLDEAGNAESYSSGDAATLRNVQTTTQLTAPWKFVRASLTYTEKEVLLNGGDSGTTSEMRFHQFKNLKTSKMQDVYTDILNKLARLIVAEPTVANMTNGDDPYSIFYSLTTDGLAPSGFTTVYGVNPTTKSKWRNQTATYTDGSEFDDTAGILAAIDQAMLLTNFQRPANASEYFTNSDLNRQAILTNREGLYTIQQIMRAGNDIYRAGPQDPNYGSPVFGGIPFLADEALDDQSSFTSGQPGYLGINANFLKLVFHRDKFLQMSEVFTPHDKPDTRVMYVDCWLQMLNQSRQRHFYVSAA
jgi:hypothetical protein